MRTLVAGMVFAASALCATRATADPVVVTGFLTGQPRGALIQDPGHGNRVARRKTAEISDLRPQPPTVALRLASGPRSLCQLVRASTGRAAKPGFSPVDSSMTPIATISCHGINSDIITCGPRFGCVRLAGTSPSQMPAAS